MKASAISLLVLCVSLSAAVEVGAQTPVGALAVDERRGDQWGWAVDYETASAAQTAALRECGAGCSVMLTFGRCGAYAADQCELVGRQAEPQATVSGLGPADL